ncbi:hypothetical protein [Nesterenkonia pannonica]|uniref:hypothetical protein n=1 Tax=Nesterenkonia pannonica TaxID=1548602 RepID=UPI0021648671|nr:hypothetical protein [Nesterenkonia pannonica]
MSRVARKLRRQRRDARRAARRERRSPAPGQDAQHLVAPDDSSAAPRTASARHAASRRRRGERPGSRAHRRTHHRRTRCGISGMERLLHGGPRDGAAPVQTVETNYGGQPELCPAAPEGVSAERVPLESGGEEDVLTATIQQADEGSPPGSRHRHAHARSAASSSWAPRRGAEPIRS